MILTVICWKWKQNGYRSSFSSEHANVLRRMVARHYPAPHEFACITDDPVGLDPEIRHIPLWDDFGKLANPSFRGGPNCYRRLRAFSPEAREIIGERFVSLDLDVVITGDLRPLWDRPDDFVILADPYKRFWYNGSMWMLRAGSRTKVWVTFDPQTSPEIANKSGQRGSDQGWIGYCLGRSERIWDTNDGVYSWRKDLGSGYRLLPGDARMVVFHGVENPWDARPQNQRWVRDNWR